MRHEHSQDSVLLNLLIVMLDFAFVGGVVWGLASIIIVADNCFEVSTSDYQYVAQESKAYPELIPLAAKILEDGKITRGEYGDFKSARDKIIALAAKDEVKQVINDADAKIFKVKLK